MRHVICIALSAAAAPAFGECPVAADMAQGIRFAVATGEVDVVKPDEEAGQTVSAFGADGYLSIVRLAHGVYPLEISELESGLPTGTAQRFTYATSPLPAPAPGLEVSLEVEVVVGAEAKAERHDYSYGAPVTWTYGRCSYEMIPITARHFRGGEETSREVLHYLPEFGHSYLASFSNGESPEVFTYVSVEAVE